MPTVELLFGTKATLLKAAIDVAIAGDDEPVPVLDRELDRAAAGAADTADEFLSVVAGVIGPAQQRSAGLVLAVFEGSSTDPELAELAEQMTAQRAIPPGGSSTAGRARPSCAGCTRQDAVDTVWVLMDPAVFDRLVRQPRLDRARVPTLVRRLPSGDS